MRTVPVVFLVALLAVPPVDASSTFNESLISNPAFLVGQLVLPASTPVLQSSRQYNFNLQRGDSIDVALSWDDATNGAPLANDLDLRLLLPSAAPVPINTDPANPGAIVASVTGSVAVRLARQTCTDAAARSNSHAALGGANGVEGFSFTVPADGEQGTYSLMVLGFLLTASQPYSLTVTITSGGADVTGARLLPFPGGFASQQTVFITSAPYCQVA